MEFLGTAEGMGIKPGTTFAYGQNHMAMAGAMAQRAIQAKTGYFIYWESIFNNFRSEHEVFEMAKYNYPSSVNPLLARGMTWTAEEYLSFLKELAFGRTLSSTNLETMSSIHQDETVKVLKSQADQLGIDMKYGLGLWVECRDQACESRRYSSAGLYGAYPVFDLDHQYVALVAKQGD